MEFREFTNPKEKDFDINSSSESSTNNYQDSNQYYEQLFDLIGILEDVTEEDLQEQYGISMSEYLHTAKDTINKVTEKISGRHR